MHLVIYYGNVLWKDNGTSNETLPKVLPLVCVNYLPKRTTEHLLEIKVHEPALLHTKIVTENDESGASWEA